jgi:exodeoxyribonuclease-3
LKESAPDVACLQELKSPDEKFPVKAIEEAGYEVCWHGQKAWNGVAILAKKNLDLQEVGKGLPGDPEDLQSRYIEATVKGSADL